MYKIKRVSNPIFIDKGPHWWKYFYLGLKKYKFE